LLQWRNGRWTTVKGLNEGMDNTKKNSEIFDGKERKSRRNNRDEGLALRGKETKH
jgi:hypothetical protein